MFTKKIKSAGGVVINKNGEVLVVSQKNNAWSLPKGGIEEGETPLEAAKREIYEESGIKNLTLIKALPSYQRFKIGKDGGEDKSELKFISMFLFKTDEMELEPIDPENPEAKWLPKENICDLLTHPKDKQFFQNVLFEIN
ncbi:MAG: NUDIX domain-containing protein [Patescibacteria group bacterium]